MDHRSHSYTQPIPIHPHTPDPQLTLLKEQKRELGEQIKTLKSGKSLKSIRTRETGDKLSEEAVKALEKAEEKKCVRACVRACVGGFVVSRVLLVMDLVTRLTNRGAITHHTPTLQPPIPTHAGARP